MNGIEKLLGRSTIAGFELRQGIEQFATHCADALGLSGIRVTWTRNTETAAINDSGDMYLSNVKDDARISRPLFVRYVGFVLHELLHRKYTIFGARSQTRNRYIESMHNAIEDIWIERCGIRDNIVGNIEQVLTDLIGGMVAEALDRVSDWADPRQYPFAMAVFGRRYAPAIPLADGLLPIFEEASRRIDDCKTSYDTLAVAEWIVAQLQLPPGQTDEGDQGDQGKGKPDKGKRGDKGQGQGDKGDDQGDQGQGDKGDDQGDGQGQGQGDKGDDQGDGQGQDGQGQGQGQGDQDQGQGQGKQGQQAGQAGQAGQGKGDIDPPSPGQRRSIAGTQNIYEVEPTLDPGSARDRNRFSAVESMAGDDRHVWPPGGTLYPAAPVSAKLRAEVRRLFDNSGTSEWSLGRKTGAVHPGALASTAAGNARPFKQRRDVEGVDSAVVLLIDVSSSMAGDRARAAIPASIALLETLAAAGVDVCVMAFSGVCSIVKPWAMSTRKGMARMSRIKVEGGTRDYAALRHAHALLLRHPAQRRVVFALSDGDGDVTAARAQNISAAALGITTIGVGIMHDVSAVYPQAVRVDNLADLGQVMFKHIKVAA